MLMQSRDAAVEFVSVEGQQFAADADGLFDIPPALVPLARKLCRLGDPRPPKPPAKAIPAARGATGPAPLAMGAAGASTTLGFGAAGPTIDPLTGDDAGKSDGDEFDRMDRAALFAWARAHDLAIAGATKTDAVRAAIRKSIADKVAP